MKSQRYNWIVLLVGALLAFGIGALGLHAGAGTAAIIWFAFGAPLLVWSIVLHRRRLP